MQRTKKDIYALIQKGEAFHLECKKAQGGLSSILWESYSAFFNTDGGVILLGVKEFEDKHFEVVGMIDAPKLIQDFTNTLNDSNKVSANVLTDKDVQTVDQKMFQFLGYSEKAGSGFPKIFMGTDEQHWVRPYLQEDFKFEQTTLIMPTVDLTAGVFPSEGGVKGGVKTTEKTSLKTGLKTGLKIVEALRSNPFATMPELMSMFDLSRNGVKWNLAELKRKGLIRRVGPDKGGHWEIVKPHPQTGGNGS